MPQTKLLLLEDDVIQGQDYINRLSQNGYIVKHFMKAKDAIAAMKTQAYDMALLDIRLAGSKTDGIETAIALCEIKPVPVVFITAFADDPVIVSRALKALPNQPIGFLPKPFNTQQLIIAIETEMANMTGYKQGKSFVDVSVMENGARCKHRLPVDNILRIEADGSYSDIYLDGGKMHKISKNLKWVHETLLKEFSQFVRVHDSHAMNGNEIVSRTKSHVILSDGSKIPIGRKYRDNLENNPCMMIVGINRLILLLCFLSFFHTTMFSMQAKANSNEKLDSITAIVDDQKQFLAEFKTFYEKAYGDRDENNEYIDSVFNALAIKVDEIKDVYESDPSKFVYVRVPEDTITTKVPLMLIQMDTPIANQMIMDIDILAKKGELKKTVKQGIDRYKKTRRMIIGAGLCLLVFLPMYIKTIKNRNKALKIERNKFELLLKELTHRVKNNLQTVSSLINLQNENLENKAAKMALNDAQNRVEAMALIYQGLYQKNVFSLTDLVRYVDDLLLSLMNFYGYAETEVATNTHEMEPILISTDHASSIGLAINEIVANSFEHGFKDNPKPKLSVNLKETKRAVILTVKDNGKGLPPGFDIEHPTSLGLQLVNLLVKQLEGKINFSSVNNNGGTIAQLILAKEVIAASREELLET